MASHEPRFDTFLQVRLTTHDKERIKARAIEAGMQTSEYVRKRALGPHKQYEVHEPPESFKRLLEREAEASIALDGETMCETPIAPHIHEARDTL